MNIGNTDSWKMPEELKPYESFMRDLGAFSCEALMNMYGSKCAHRLAMAGMNPREPEAVELRAILANAQVGLLAALKGARLLRSSTPPKIVCLCGSTRFWRTFQEASLKETLAGNIVLSIGAARCADDDKSFGGYVPAGKYDEVKQRLDELHLRKIDEADEVLILNVGGYIGESTANELAYARKQGKVVRFLEAEK